MKKKVVPLLFILVPLLIFSCANDENEIPIESLTGNEISNGEKFSLSKKQDPEIVAHRARFEIAIIDYDGWEIHLNMRKRRRVPHTSDSLYTYTGFVLYRKPSRVVRGMASAQYDMRTQTLTVCGHDSIYNRGYILYHLKLFHELDYEGWNMHGSYWYNKWPQNMNVIPARMFQGRISIFRSYPLEEGLSKDTEPAERIKKFDEYGKLED